MKSVVITSAVRTAGGKLGGALKDFLPEELTKLVIEGAISKSQLEKSIIDEVVVGQAKQSTDAPNIARVAALKAGIPEEVPAYTVHRQCASGMQAVISAAWQIQSGYADVIVAAGVESMSTAPYYIRRARFGYRSGNGELLDPNTESQPKSQPQDIYGTFNMIQTAENLAKAYGISREEQDRFALQSQKKAIQAIDTGRFRDEIIPVEIPRKKGEIMVFDADEHPRRDTTLEKMSKLAPVIEGGTVTAANASGRNDGASAVVIMSEEKAREMNIKPMVRLISAGIAGVDPRIMGSGPVPATKKALKRAGLAMEDIGLIELNEAFAAQTLACIKELNINREILNVNGGAIALGHPLGCSGNRIIVTLIHEMLKRRTKYGLASICVAGGLGVTTIYENLL